MFLYIEYHTINQTLIYSGVPPPSDNIRKIPFSNLLHRHTEHPKSKVTDNLPAKDGSSNNGISKYIDVALHN